MKRSQRAWSIVVALAVTTLLVERPAGAAAPPVPDGFVQLVDDSLTLTMTVPESWTTGDTSTYVYEDQWRQVEVSAADPDNTGTAPAASVRALPPGSDVGNPASSFADRCTSYHEEPHTAPVGGGTHYVGVECRGWGPPANHFAEQHAFVLTADDGSAIVSISISATGPEEVALVPLIVESVALRHDATPTEVAEAFLAALAEQDGSLACELMAPGADGNFVLEPQYACWEDLTARLGDESELWAGISIASAADPAPAPCGDGVVVTTPTGPQCLTLAQNEFGDWRVVALSDATAAVGTAVLPEGFVEVVNDAGTIAVVAPMDWTENVISNWEPFVQVDSSTGYARVGVQEYEADVDWSAETPLSNCTEIEAAPHTDAQGRSGTLYRAPNCGQAEFRMFVVDDLATAVTTRITVAVPTPPDAEGLAAFETTALTVIDWSGPVAR